MKTINGGVSFGRRLFCVISFLMLAIGITSAQAFTNVDSMASTSLATDKSVTRAPTTTTIADAQLADEYWPPTIITNAAQFADGFSWQNGLYMPDDSFRWTLYLSDGAPWWIDFSQWPPLQVLATNQCRGATFYGILPRRVSLTLELLTGEIVVRSLCSTNELMRLEPPADYQPGQWPVGSVAAAQLWKHWLEAKADPTWAENWGPLKPPTLVLRVELADLVSEKPVRDKNFAAAIAAWAAAEAQAATAPSKTLTLLGGSGKQLMALGSGTSSSTNETEAFGVDIAPGTNGTMVLTWQSCSLYVYGVLSIEDLTLTNAWVGRAGMWGQDGTTSWTDTTAGTVDRRFYKVVRMPPEGDFSGCGIPNGWLVDNGLNPLDPNDANQASSNPWAHGLTWLQVYQNPSVLLADGYSSLGDSLPDWWKIINGYSPTTPGSTVGANGLTLTENYQNDPIYQAAITAALDQFNVGQVDLLRSVMNLSAISWNQTADNSTRIGQIRTSLEPVLVNCLDLTVHGSSFGDTNVVVKWTLVTVLNAAGNTTGTWLSGPPSLEQVNELQAVLAQLTRVPSDVSSADTGVSGQDSWPDYEDEMPYCFDEWSVSANNPTQWPASWKVSTYVLFTTADSDYGYYLDDYLTLNGADNHYYAFCFGNVDVTEDWLTNQVNEVQAWDEIWCRLYCSDFQIVHVLEVPVIKITKVMSDQFSGADVNCLPPIGSFPSKNKPMLMGCSAGTTAKIKVEATVDPAAAAAGQVYVGVRKQGTAEILGSCPINSGGQTPVTWDCEEGGVTGIDVIYEIVAYIDSNGNGALDPGETYIVYPVGVRVFDQAEYDADKGLLSALSPGAWLLMPTASALLSFFLNNIRNDATVSLSDPVLYHPVGVAWAGTTGSCSKYNFVNLDRVVSATEFQRRLTAQAYTNHYAEIVAYFVTNPGTTHTFGPWSCTLGALDFPDPGFGVVAGINADMFYAFGGVRDFTVTSYQLTMQDVGFNNIWPVVNITAQGSFTDLYDFDIYNGTLSRMGATVQAGFPTLGGAGRVFQETIKFNGTWP